MREKSVISWGLREELVCESRDSCAPAALEWTITPTRRGKVEGEGKGER